MYKVNPQDEVSKENSINANFNITKQSKESLLQYYFNKNSSEEFAKRKKKTNFFSQ